MADEPLKGSVDKIANSVHAAAATRVMVMLGTPVMIALLGWAASNFDQMRLDIVAIKGSLGTLQEADRKIVTRVRSLEARVFGIPLVPEERDVGSH